MINTIHLSKTPSFQYLKNMVHQFKFSRLGRIINFGLNLINNPFYRLPFRNFLFPETL